MKFFKKKPIEIEDHDVTELLSPISLDFKGHDYEPNEEEIRQMNQEEDDDRV